MLPTFDIRYRVLVAADLPRGCPSSRVHNLARVILVCAFSGLCFIPAGPSEIEEGEGGQPCLFSPFLVSRPPCRWPPPSRQVFRSTRVSSGLTWILQPRPALCALRLRHGHLPRVVILVRGAPRPSPVPHFRLSRQSSQSPPKKTNSASLHSRAPGRPRLPLRRGRSPHQDMARGMPVARRQRWPWLMARRARRRCRWVRAQPPTAHRRQVPSLTRVVPHVCRNRLGVAHPRRKAHPRTLATCSSPVHRAPAPSLMATRAQRRSLSTPSSRPRRYRRRIHAHRHPRRPPIPTPTPPNNHLPNHVILLPTGCHLLPLAPPRHQSSPGSPWPRPQSSCP